MGAAAAAAAGADKGTIGLGSVTGASGYIWVWMQGEAKLVALTTKTTNF